MRVEPIGVTFRLAEGETLIQAAWREGYYWPTVCGGRAECTVCHVLIEAGEGNAVTADEYENAMIAQVVERMRPCRAGPAGLPPAGQWPSHRL